MKIEVKALESRNELGASTDGELEMVQVNGKIINLGGRSRPF